MTTTDALIIFLSFGSPFAVHHFVQSRNRESVLMRLAGSFYNLIFWLPIIVFRGISFLTEQLSRMSSNHREANGAASEFDQLERIISGRIIDQSDITLLFRFKDVFAKYFGLSLFIKDIRSESDTTVNEIFKIAGHQSPELANRCLSRRNLQRVRWHQSLARNEFLDLTASRVLNGDQTLSNAMVRISEIVSDPQLVRALSLHSTTDSSSDERRVSELETVTKSETVITVAG